MARVVHKFKVPLDGGWNGVLLPRDANIIHVGNVYSDKPHELMPSAALHFWVEVPADEKPADYHFPLFRVYATGEPITEETAVWAGTFIEDGFVWHLYMKPE